jgi:threonylcarbamoyladenosine tRNA methylthiotransferase MtaB
VIDDVRRAIAAGYKEIAITACTSAPTAATFHDLVAGDLLGAGGLAGRRAVPREFAGADGLHAESCRWWLSTTDRPHFPSAAAACADAMLRAMRRPYTAAYYQALVWRIVALMPHASIGSDVIVGFPEKQSAIRRERSVLRDLPLSHLHVFPYSDRPGTEASAMQPKVDGVLIRERARQLESRHGDDT